MFDYCLFDLDGTLTDPKEGITNSVAYSLLKFGITVSDRSDLIKFIGPPLLDSYREFYGFSKEDSVKALHLYREYFADKGIFENALYPDTVKLLKTLKSRGKKVILATSKPEPYAVTILRHFGIFEYFDLVVGASMDEKLSEKSEIIALALHNAEITDTSKAVMIGDRMHDIYGAKQNNIFSVGVLYGYGSFDELIAAGADVTVKDIEELLNVLK